MGAGRIPKEKMKLAFYAPWEIKDGIYEYTKQLREGLTEIGVPSDVIPYLDDRISSAYLQTIAQKINKSYNLVHIQHEFSYFGDWRNPFNHLFADFLRSIKVKKVVTAHIFHPMLLQLDPSFPNPPFRRVKKLVQSLIILTPWAKYTFAGVFNEADLVIVHSEFHKEHLLKYGVSKDKVLVMPMGIQKMVKPSNSGKIPKRFSIEGKIVLTVFGFLDPAKGYDLALEALAFLPERYILLLAGGARTLKQERYQKILWARVSALGLEKRIFQTGYLTEEEVGQVMSVTDIQLVPQKNVAGSQSLQTGLGYGRAIIASDLPYAKEMQQRLECVVLFPTGDVAKLTQKIKELGESPKKRLELQKKANLYGQKYSWKNVATSYKEKYEDLLRNI